MTRQYQEVHASLEPDKKRLSLWLMCGAMVLIVALKSDRVEWPYFNSFGWPLMLASLLSAWSQPNKTWFKTTVLFAYTIIVLWFTRVDGDTSNRHSLELFISLGVGILLIPALLAKYWLKTPLDYQWIRGPWISNTTEYSVVPPATSGVRCLGRL